MARYERDGRDLPVTPKAKIKLRRRADGSLEIGPQARPETVAETVQEHGTPLADDVRSSTDRNIPNTIDP